MYSTFQKIFLILVYISALYISGCGGDSALGQSQDTVVLRGVVSDGPIVNAKVVLASMRKGILSSESFTGLDGSYELLVPKATIKSLQFQDLPYIYACSTSQSSVLTSGGRFRALENGQLSFRSLLSTDQLKALISSNATVITTAEANDPNSDHRVLSQNLLVNHITNAKSLMLEASLFTNDILQSNLSLTPELIFDSSTYPDTKINEILNLKNTLDAALNNSDSADVIELVKLSAMTKEIIEHGSTNIIMSAESSLEVSQAPNLLLEVATYPRSLSLDFSQRLDQRLIEVKNDIFSNQFVSASSELISRITSITVQKINDDVIEDIQLLKRSLGHQIFNFDKRDILSGSKTALLTFSAEQIPNNIELYVNQIDSQESSYQIEYRKMNTEKILSLRVDLTKPSDLNIIEIDGISVNVPLHEGTINGVTNFNQTKVKLSSPVTSIQSSYNLTNGYFYEVQIGHRNSTWNLIFGSVNINSESLPLGIVGIKGIFDSDNMYFLAKAEINGQNFPEVSQAGSSNEVNQNTTEDANQIWMEPNHSINMILISSGVFTMGSNSTELHRNLDEGPQRDIMINNNFYIGQYEVTQGQWNSVMGEDNHWISNGTQNPTTIYGLGDQYPAYFVSWEDITQLDGFLDKLNLSIDCDTSYLPNDSTRYHPANVKPGCFRLPSEAEWEYAARSGSLTRFSFGNDIEYDRIREYAWFAFNSGNLEESHQNYGTQSVGSKLNNKFGLFDIYGNVSEWVYDLYNSDYYLNGLLADPHGPLFGSHYVERGGNWMYPASLLRSAARSHYSPHSRYPFLGFRLLYVPLKSIDNNNPPEANEDVFEVFYNETAIIDILNNDSDIDNDLMTITNITNLSGGTLSMVTNSSLLAIHPFQDSTQPVRFNYRIADGNGGLDNSEVTIYVSTANLPTVLIPEIWHDPYIGVEMLRVSSGNFTMGTPSSEEDRFMDEGPQHDVLISNDFLIGRYELTQSQWESVMGEQGAANNWPGGVSNSPSSSYGLGSDYPAYFISWDDINQIGGFLDRINTLAGCYLEDLPSNQKRYDPSNVSSGCYRLPTEAEWEYAARAGTNDKFSFGDDASFQSVDQFAWYRDNSIDGSTMIVGQKLPNPFGIFDIHGNVAEFVYDRFSYYKDSQITNPAISNSGLEIIVRGGSWASPVSALRVGQRVTIDANRRNYFTGFRLALVPGRPSVPKDIIFNKSNQFFNVNWRTSAFSEYEIYYSASADLSTGSSFIKTSSTYVNIPNTTDRFNFYIRIASINPWGKSDLSSVFNINPETWIDPKTSVEMLRISSGNFFMGTPADEVDRFIDEGPQHQVTIDRDFLMGRYEITQAQWKSVMGEKLVTNHWPGSTEKSPSLTYGLGDNYPAYFISWEDINKIDGFLDRINTLAGCNIDNLPENLNRYHPSNVPVGCYRLPTEAEWEYAARFGTLTRFPYGNDLNYELLPQFAWFASNSAETGTSIIGEKLPNPVGLFDMHGNVSELVYDRFNIYTGSPSINPTGPITGSNRIIRGGSWDSEASSLRSGQRESIEQTIRSSSIGFRVLIVPGPPPVPQNISFNKYFDECKVEWSKAAFTSYEIFYDNTSDVSREDASITTSSPSVIMTNSENSSELYLRIEARNPWESSDLSEIIDISSCF